MRLVVVIRAMVRRGDDTSNLKVSLISFLLKLDFKKVYSNTSGQYYKIIGYI